jgi:pyrimidine operon attenuation protein / uracil phosphoribosyltransferase
MQQDIAARNCILTADLINRKIRRMALQVAESNTEEGHIIVAGIAGNGAVLAQKLVAELKQVSSLEVQLLTIRINKKEPTHASLETDGDFTNKVILVVDDVANSGRTMLYALKPFLSYLPKKIQTLVLVERSHKLFAVQPDYVGLSVATTLQEHITVETKGEEITGAWLH